MKTTGPKPRPLSTTLILCRKLGVLAVFQDIFHFRLCSKVCSSLERVAKDFCTFIKYSKSLNATYWISSLYTNTNLKFHHELVLQPTAVNADVNTLFIPLPITCISLIGMLLGNLLGGIETGNIDIFEVFKKSHSILETKKNANQWPLMCFLIGSFILLCLNQEGMERLEDKGSLILH